MTSHQHVRVHNLVPLLVPVPFMLVLGVLGLLWPYEVTRFGERVDAIGSKRSWSSVEPADWNVRLTRAMSVVFLVLSVAILAYVAWTWPSVS